MKKEEKDMTQKNMKEQEKELEKEATDTPEVEKSGNEGKKEVKSRLNIFSNVFTKKNILIYIVSLLVSLISRYTMT